MLGIVFPNELMDEKQFCGRKKELTILSNTMWGEKAPQVSTSLKFCCVVCLHVSVNETFDINRLFCVLHLGDQRNGRSGEIIFGSQICISM